MPDHDRLRLFALSGWTSLIEHMYDEGMAGSAAPSTVDRPSLGERQAAVAVAIDALEAVGDALWEASGADLADLMSDLDLLVRRASAAQLAVTAEALDRGEVDRSRSAGVTGWVKDLSPGLARGGTGGAGALARAAEAAVNVRRGGEQHLADVTDAVLEGRVSAPIGNVVRREAGRLHGRVEAEAFPTVVEGMLRMGEEHGASGARLVRPELLARYGLPDELQREHDSRRMFARLSRPAEDDGMMHYGLDLTEEQAAVLEAAIGPLSAPRPTDGRRDLRPSDQRRAEALITQLQHGVACGEQVASEGDGEGGDGTSVGGLCPPSRSKATLLVTMSLADLESRVGAGRVLGSLQTGQHLPPETVRRLACDARVIPAVLGGSGQVLGIGRARRLFSAAQLAALWLRDAGCTFPGCTAPGHWTDAHHIVHWADGGATDLDNATLLCQRHHTIVHRDRLVARVVPPDREGGSDPPPGAHRQSVVWDLGGGSYDRMIASRFEAAA